MDLRVKETLLFIHKLQQLYLVERDIEGVMELLDHSITWVGTGEGERVNSREEARQFLILEKRGFPSGYAILDSDFQVQVIDETISAAIGVLAEREAGMEDVFESLNLRVTVICVKRTEGLRAVHIHMSAPSKDQLETEFFPRILSGEDTKMLRKLLDEQSIELRHKNKNLNALIGNIPGSVMCCEYSEDLELIQYSDRFLQMLGYTKEELGTIFDHKFRNMIYPEDFDKTWTSVQTQLKKGNSKELEYRLTRKDGSIIRILDQGQLVERDGRDVFYCILTDITEKRETMEALRLSLERHEIIMAQTTDIIFEWDLKRDTLQISDNWYTKFGYEPVLEHIYTAVPTRNHLHEEDVSLFFKIIERLKSHTEFIDEKIRIKKVDGTAIWCRVRVKLQVDENGIPNKAIGVIVDVDEETRQTQILLERAEKDTLTGLYNKGATERIASKYMKDATAKEGCAFMIIDIDDFKLINDSFGHLSGDVMLTELASSLQRIFDKTDVIGRIGGDEFAVVIQCVKAKEEVIQKAKEVCSIFNRLLREEAYTLSCSIGIAFAPDNGTDFQVVYQNADLALYEAKAAGKNNYNVYSEEMKRNMIWKQQDISDQNVYVESEAVDTAWGDRIIEYVFSVLYDTAKVEDTIEQILEIVGRKFNVSRVYIFEDSEEGLYSTNTFEWCNDGISPQKNSLQNISYQMLNYYQDNFDDNGIFYSRDVQELPEAQHKFLSDQGIKAILQAQFYDNGVKKGFVGFDDCNMKRYWTKEQVNTLNIISKVISVFLLKKRLQDKLVK